jgi:thiamine-phosphate pyrophosphorylase
VPIVCVVTDRRRVSPAGAAADGQWRAFERWLDEAVEAGPDLIQIRERDLDARDLCRIVRRAARRAEGTSVRVLVNDRADVACIAGAAGVHLPGDGPPAVRVRALGPDGWTIGRSVHSVAEVQANQDADCLILGSVFPTRSKPAGAPVAGLEMLRAAATASRRPVIAIGGVTASRAASIVGAGAAGVAAIGLFLPAGLEPDALGPARAVAALRAAMLQ